MSADDPINLPGGHTARFRTALTGGDQKWFYIERDKLMRANGSGKPASVEPDPANPAALIEVPAVPPSLTVEDNFTMLDRLIGRLMTSWSRPEPLPWTGALRDGLDLEVIDALDNAVAIQMRRLQGIGPKSRTAPTSATTSGEDAPAPHPAPTAEPSSTAPAS